MKAGAKSGATSGATRGPTPPTGKAGEPGGCPHDQSLLALQAGGDLTDRQSAALRSHLHGCDDCRRALGEFRATREWLRANMTPAVDAAVLAELRGRVVVRLGRKRPFPWLLAVMGRAWASWCSLGWQPVRGLAVATLLVVGALGSLSSLNGRLLDGGFNAIQPAQTRGPAAAQTGMIGSEAGESEDSESEDTPAEDSAESEPLTLDGGFDDPPSAANGLRIEMQTPDPNVRIIWFASNSEAPGRGR